MPIALRQKRQRAVARAAANRAESERPARAGARTPGAVNDVELSGSGKGSDVDDDLINNQELMEQGDL